MENLRNLFALQNKMMNTKFWSSFSFFAQSYMQFLSVTCKNDDAFKNAIKNELHI